MYEVQEKDGLKFLQLGEQRLVNLCSHDIQIATDSENKKVTIPPSGVVARVVKKQKDVEKYAGFSIIREVYGNLYGIPDKKENTIYIVSAPVLNCLNDTRDDIVTVGKQTKDPSSGKTIFASTFRRCF